MSRTVLLHVGCPKTGTSYLQDVLFRNQELLRAHDILYPADYVEKVIAGVERYGRHALVSFHGGRLPGEMLVLFG